MPEETRICKETAGRKTVKGTTKLLVTEKSGGNRQLKVAQVELRDGRGLHESERPGWSAGGIEKQPVNQKPPGKKSNQRHKNMLEFQELPKGPLGIYQ